MSIRSRRRNRHRMRAWLNRMDEIIGARINRSYMQSSATWGGTRCPDCGANCRPYQLVPGGDVLGYVKRNDGRKDRFILSIGVAPQCHLIKGCLGKEIDWQ